MKKTTKILYLALLLSMTIGACTPCDDGDTEELNSHEKSQTLVDSLATY